MKYLLSDYGEAFREMPRADIVHHLAKYDVPRTHAAYKDYSYAQCLGIAEGIVAHQELQALTGGNDVHLFTTPYNRVEFRLDTVDARFAREIRSYLNGLAGGTPEKEVLYPE